MTVETPDTDKSSNVIRADSQEESEASKEVPIAMLRVHDLEGAAILFLPTRFGEIIGKESSAQLASEIEDHLLTVTKRTATDLVFARLSIVVHRQQSIATNADLDSLKPATETGSDNPASKLAERDALGCITSDIYPGSQDSDNSTSSGDAND